jgi:hypothetical protein
MSKITLVQQGGDLPNAATGQQTYYGKDDEAWVRNPTGDPKQLTNPPDASQSEAETGTETENRSWSPERIKDAIDTLAPGAVGRMFFAADPNGNNDNYRVRDVGGTAAHRFNFQVPDNFASLSSLKLVGIVSSAAAQVNRNIDLYSSYGAAGESITAHQESDVTTLYDLSASADKFYELDISAVFTSLAAGDYCGIQVDHMTLGGSVDYIGIAIQYVIS